MEHSLLHAVQLLGLLGVLGGAFFALLVLKPALACPSVNQAWSEVLDGATARFAISAALIAALAGLISVFVQVAELQGGTVYQGVRLADVRRYLTETTVGRLVAGRIGLLGLAGGILLYGGRWKWVGCCGAALGAGLCGTLVSHAAALPTSRGPALAAQIVHILAAALWLGMLVHFWRVNCLLNARDQHDAVAVRKEVLRRFSPFGLIGVALVGISGLYGAYRFLRTPDAVLLSAYGMTLLLKLGLLGFALFAGFRNWRVIRPAILQSSEEDKELTSRFGRLLELEVTAGTIVVVLAGIVGSISPPGVDGSARINSEQVAAVLSVEMPPTRFIDPASFVGADTRTDLDLQYSEFTHRWSGVLVLILGLLWLGQSMGGPKMRSFCGWGWPALLIPFGLFVAVFADPEPWLMRNVSLSELLRNPEIIEHQIGAILVFLLAALGFRDRRREVRLRPLGFALPVIMILGSLMLLGHAHSNLRMSEELSSLINIQHAVLGGFGLIAGFMRWLQLRGVFFGSWVKVAWPVGVALLGVGMAFFYTELV